MSGGLFILRQFPAENRVSFPEVEAHTRSHEVDRAYTFSYFNILVYIFVGCVLLEVSKLTPSTSCTHPPLRHKLNSSCNFVTNNRRSAGVGVVVASSLDYDVFSCFELARADLLCTQWQSFCSNTKRPRAGIRASRTRSNHGGPGATYYTLVVRRMGESFNLF